jgi:hypothetical protein
MALNYGWRNQRDRNGTVRQKVRLLHASQKALRQIAPLVRVISSFQATFTSTNWSSVLLGAAVMAYSLLAYFFSMVTAFAFVMTALVSFGDSQLRTMRPLHSPAVSIIAGSDRDAFENSDRAREAQKAAEARKALEAQRGAEVQKAAEARETAKKVARTKLARERKQAMVARLRQEREQRNNSWAFGYANQSSGGARLFSYAPSLDRF